MKAAQDIIIKPIITEHSMEALASGKYTFKVAKDANKSGSLRLSRHSSRVLR